MTTDTILIEESLEKVINYNWEEEMRHFQEQYEVEIQSQDDLGSWINWCQEATPQWEGSPETAPVNHIFYDLMVLKSSLKTEL